MFMLYKHISTEYSINSEQRITVYMYMYLFIIRVDIVPLNTIGKLFAMNVALSLLIFGFN